MSIEPLNIRIQPTLPMHVTDELSFLEMLLKFQAKLNELIKAIDDFESDANDYTDTEISKLRSELLSRITVLQNQINDINLVISTIEDGWDIKLKQMFDRTIEVFELSQQLQTLDFNTALYNLRNEIINMLVYGFLVIDPTTGKENTVTNSLYNLYNAFMQNYGISVDEYDALQLSVAEYDAVYINVYDYTFASKDVLFSTYFSPYFNPFTGLRSGLQNILNTLAGFHMENLNVSEYDALEIDVNTYDALEVLVDEYKTFRG